ncbi:MAG TPA: hypothetical protein VMU81_01440 [Acetobacteraceae bacterium]|nr:hypothetical protein [Acetobacteraceae bacterium]
MVETGDSPALQETVAGADSGDFGESAEAGCYRIYLIGRDNHIRSHGVIWSAHEEDAVAEAVLLVGEYPRVEVWNGTRLVRRLILPGSRPPHEGA